MTTAHERDAEDKAVFVNLMARAQHLIDGIESAKRRSLWVSIANLGHPVTAFSMEVRRDFKNKSIIVGKGRTE